MCCLLYALLQTIAVGYLIAGPRFAKILMGIASSSGRSGDQANVKFATIAKRQVVTPPRVGDMWHTPSLNLAPRSLRFSLSLSLSLSSKGNYDIIKH